MKKSFLVLMMTLSCLYIYAEDVFLFARTSVFNSQFWERHASDVKGIDDRRVFTNGTGASIGTGVEWTIWDMGKTRGSRIFLFGGLDLVFMGLNYLGTTEDIAGWSPLKDVVMPSGGIFYSGIKFDLYFGGTFPKTDLKWGFGSDFYLTFNTWAEKQPTPALEIFTPFFTPSLILAYDFFIGQQTTKYKITPMLKAGLTCMPLVPDHYLDMKNYEDPFSHPENWYSGFYIELSVSTSFTSIPWRK